MIFYDNVMYKLGYVLRYQLLLSLYIFFLQNQWNVSDIFFIDKDWFLCECMWTSDYKYSLRTLNNYSFPVVRHNSKEQVS